VTDGLRHRLGLDGWWRLSTTWADGLRHGLGLDGWWRLSTSTQVACRLHGPTG
jgi:hypothetical protein